MGSGGGDPPPTVTSVGSAGTRAGLDGFYEWVEYRFSVDSPSHHIALNVKETKSQKLQSEWSDLSYS